MKVWNLATFSFGVVVGGTMGLTLALAVALLPLGEGAESVLRVVGGVFFVTAVVLLLVALSLRVAVFGCVMRVELTVNFLRLTGAAIGAPLMLLVGMSAGAGTTLGLLGTLIAVVAWAQWDATHPPQRPPHG